MAVFTDPSRIELYQPLATFSPPPETDLKLPPATLDWPPETELRVRLALTEDDRPLVTAMPLVLRAPAAVRIRAEAQLARRNADLLIGPRLRNETTGEMYFAPRSHWTASPMN